MEYKVTPRIIVIGHSHTACLQRAYQTRLRDSNNAGVDLSFVQMNDAAFQPNISAGELNSEARMIIKNQSNAIIISMMGGNAYNVFGLLNHHDPFDFVLAEQPDLPVRAGATLLPFKQLRSRLRRQMVYTLNSFSALRKATDLPIFHLESPPPIPSEAHITRYPGVFRDRIDSLGVSPPVLRYKLWRTHTDLIREACGDNEISFIPAPPAMQDEHGMMVAEAWNPDPTHGNELYGEHLFQQIVEIASSGAFEFAADIDKQPHVPTYDHPYKSLPNHSYWRRAISDVHPDDVDPVGLAPFKIVKSDRVATAGSCFAQHIARYLRSRGYNYFITENCHAFFDEDENYDYNYGIFTARFGNIYTARQLLQLFDRCYGHFLPADDLWKDFENQIIDPFRPQIQPE